MNNFPAGLERSAVFFCPNSYRIKLYIIPMRSTRSTNFRRCYNEGVTTQTLVSIVEAGITTIASIVYMLYERRKEEKRLDLQQLIDEAKNKMEKL